MTRGLSWLSTALAFILVVECGALTYSVYSKIRRETQPDQLVNRIERAMVANYPEIKRSWLEATEQRAPQLAQQFSRSIIPRLPKLRAELEEITVRDLERGIDNAVELSADEFREWLRDNHQAIEDVFVQVEQAPNDAKLLVLDTEASLEEQLGVDLQDQAKLTLELYRIINDKLERLADPNAQLTQQERLERRTIRIVRALTMSTPDTRNTALRKC